MVIERRTIANDNLRYHLHLLERRRLKSIHIDGVHFRELMEIHIQDRRAQQLRLHKALVELFGGIYLLHEFIRHHLACLIMEGIGRQNLRFVAVVLHELRRQFHKISRCVRAAKRSVMRLTHQAVQGMTELVEQGLYIVHRQQRRIILRRLIEIAYIDDHRPMIHAVLIHVLRQDIVHPRSRTLACPREIVGVENTHQLPCFIRYAEGLHLLVIDRQIRYALEIKSVQVMRQQEGTLTYVIELEIGFQLLLVQGIFLLTQFLGVVPPVPRL